MRAQGTLSVAKRTIPVEVEAAGRVLRITAASAMKPVRIEGRKHLTRWDRLVNWIRLTIASRSPVRCAFRDVSLNESEGIALLTVAPGWPWGEPLRVCIQQNDRGILNEWYMAALSVHDGKSVRCGLTPHGFFVSSIDSGDLRATVRWDDVKAVRAFKRDLFAHDMICVAFQLPDKTWLEIWEESEGFVPIIEKMAQTLPGIPEEWQSDIMVPPFVTMDTLLYRCNNEYGHWPHCPHCNYDLTGNVSAVSPECGERI